MVGARSPLLAAALLIAAIVAAAWVVAAGAAAGRSAERGDSRGERIMSPRDDPHDAPSAAPSGAAGASSRPGPQEGGGSQSQPAHPPHGGGDHRHDDATDDATVTHPFDDIARWTSVFDDPARDAWQKPAEVVAALKLRPGMNVADIGAGTGYFNRYLAKAVAPDGKLYAVDVEPKMVDNMKDRAVLEETPNVVPLLAERDDPKLPAAAVDLVLICNTYHHINDRLKYFDRIKKSYRPGARLAVVDFHKRELPVGPPPEHKLPPEHVIGEMEKIGYVLAERPEILPYQYFLIFAVK